MNKSLDELAVFVQRKSEYIEAFDFEVYDIYGTVMAFRNSRPVLYTIIGIYLLGIYFGQKWMEGRRAFELKIPLVLWNLSLTVFSIIATLRILPEVWYTLSQKDGVYELICIGCATLNAIDSVIIICLLDRSCDCGALPHNYATSFWLLMYVLSKIVELGDTAFIILRKQKLIALQWFHHMAMLLVCWMGYESHDPVGRIFVLNTIVHSFMYSYYGLKALKIKIPIKVSKALTSIQIGQLFAGVFFGVRTATFLAEGRECRMNKQVLHLGIAMGSIFIILFINFFRKTYSRKNVNTYKSE